MVETSPSPRRRSTLNMMLKVDKSLKMVLEGKMGGVYRVQADVLKEALLPFASKDGRTLYVMHETLARYTFDDIIGYGIAEYLIRNF